jgi:hypothetical protein
MKWASLTLATFLLAGCANSQQALQNRPSNTKTAPKQVAAAKPSSEYSSLLAALQHWSEEFTSSVRTAQAVRACRETLIAMATPYRPKHVEAIGAGPVRRTRRGMTAVPIHARVTYDWGRGIRVRQARLTCQLNDSSMVVAFR